MNKILIVCGGKEIVIETKSTVKEIADFIEMRKENEFVKINSNTVISPYDVTLIKDITSEAKITLTIDGDVIASTVRDKVKLATPDMCCVGDTRNKECVKPLKNSEVLNNLAKHLGECVKYNKCTPQHNDNSDVFLVGLIYEEPADSSGEYFNCCIVKRVENNRVILFDGREIAIDKLRVKRIEGSRVFLCEI